MFIDDLEKLCSLLRADKPTEARTVFSSLPRNAYRSRLEDIHMQMAHESYAASEDAKEDTLQMGQRVRVLPGALPRFRLCTGEPHLMDLLNEHDDVQNVFANFEVSDALIAKMGG